MLTRALALRTRTTFVVPLVVSVVAACSSDDAPADNKLIGGAPNQANGGNPQATGGNLASGGTAPQGGTSSNFGGTTSGVSCSQAKLLCKIATPACPAMQVPELTSEGTCFTGQCIPIANCSCSSPTDCPDNNQYTCNNSTKRCTPYLI